jgi:hypothetical protein
LHTDLAELSAKWKFTFGKKHGVVLIMVNSILHTLRRSGNLRPVLKILDERLKGKVLITETVTCDAYALIVSRGKDQSATIGVAASHRNSPSPSITVAPGAESATTGASSATTGTTAASSTTTSAGAGTEFSWIHSSTSGVWKVGSEPGYTYIPLLELSVLKQRWRDWSDDPVTQRHSQDLINADTVFVPYLPPWDPLDDNGEEIPEPLVEVSLFSGNSSSRLDAELDFSDDAGVL